MRLWLLPFVACLLCGCRSAQPPTREVAARTSYSQTETTLPVVTASAESQGFAIEELVHLGLANSPRIKQAKHRVQSLRYRVPQARSLPDPVLSSTTHLSPVETAAGRQAFALGVSQKFVNADRRATKAAVAADEVRVAEAEVVRLQQELVEQVRVTGFQLLALRETLRVTEQDADSLAKIEEVVRRKYEVEKGVSQQDVLSVQIEQSAVENQMTELRRREKSLSARLSRLVHLAPGTVFDITDSLEVMDREHDVDALIAEAIQSRPELDSQFAELRRNRREICLAHLQRKPDFTLGLNWIATSRDGISPVANGDDALLLGISFNLPVREDRITGALRQASQSTLASTEGLQVLRDEIAEEVFDTVASLDSASMTRTLLEKDILPKSQRAFDLTLEQYGEGESDYDRLVETWRAVLKYRVALVNLQSRQRQLQATLTRQIGRLEPALHGEVDNVSIPTEDAGEPSATVDLP